MRSRSSPTSARTVRNLRSTGSPRPDSCRWSNSTRASGASFPLRCGTGGAIFRAIDLARIRIVPRRAAPRRVRGRARPAGTDQGGADRPDGAGRAARPGPRQHSGACRVTRARRASRDRPEQHFIARCRQLSAAALGYRVEGPPRFGLVPPPPAAGGVPDRPFVVVVHGTSRADKLWPDAHWRRLIGTLAASGFAVVAAVGERRRTHAQRALRRRHRQCARSATAAPDAARARGPPRARRTRRRRRHGPRASRRGARYPDGFAVRRDRSDELRRRRSPARMRAIWGRSARPRRRRRWSGRGGTAAPRAALLTPRCADSTRCSGTSRCRCCRSDSCGAAAASPVIASMSANATAGTAARSRNAVLWVHAVSLGETRAAAPLVERLRRAHPDGDGAADAHDRDGPRDRTRAVRRQRRAGVAAVRRCRSPCGRSSRISSRARASSWKPNCGRISSRSRARPACRSTSSTRGCRRDRARLYAASPRSCDRCWPRCRASPRRRRPTRAARRAGRAVRNSHRKPEIRRRVARRRRSVGPGVRARFGATRPVWVAASTRDGEEAMLLDALAQAAAERPLTVIVPRHPQRFAAVAELLRRRGIPFVRRSGNAPVTDRHRRRAGRLDGRNGRLFRGRRRRVRRRQPAAAGRAESDRADQPWASRRSSVRTCSISPKRRAGAIAAGAAVEVADARALIAKSRRCSATRRARERCAPLRWPFTPRTAGQRTVSWTWLAPRIARPSAAGVRGGAVSP